MSNLVEHARRELAIVGEDPKTTEGLIKVVQAFADMGHSGGSASVAIPMLERLLSFENLTPLTDDPAEWQEHDAFNDKAGRTKWWQNTRNSKAFSWDHGQTYFFPSTSMTAVYETTKKDNI